MIKRSSESSRNIGFKRQSIMHYALSIMHCNKWLLLTLCLVTSVTGHASVNASDSLTASKVFADIPLEALDLIRPSARLDMIDYYEQADSLLTVQNALGGESRLEQVAPDYLKVSVTPISTLEIKLLQSGKNKVIMTLYTVWNSGFPAGDTEVRFFDSNLNPLPTEKFLKAPTLKDFFNLKGSSVTEKELQEKLPFTTILYSTGTGDTALTATFTTLEALSQEDRDLLTPLLKGPLTLQLHKLTTPQTKK